MAWTEKYVTTTGAGAHDGSSEANAWTLAEAFTSAASGNRVNVKSGTYSPGADIFETITGIWYRGYNTTIGDCDDDVTLSRPTISFTGDQYLSLSGDGGIWSSIDMTGSRGANGTLFINSSNRLIIRNCKISNTRNDGSSSAHAIQLTQNDGCVIDRCYLSATDSAASVLYALHNVHIRNTTLSGGKHGIELGSAGGTYGSSVIGCVFDDNGTHGIYYNQSGATFNVDRCSFYSPATDGIRFNTVPIMASITNSIFANCGGYGINNAVASSEWKVYRSNNLFYSNTSGTETGFGDNPSIKEQTDSSSPYTNAGSDDFDLVSTSNGKANGAPGTFLQITSTQSYLDIGAVQRQEPAGGVPNTTKVFTNIGTY